jgi:transcription antitermination factor NusG
MSDTDAWFIVATKPKQEFIAKQNLELLGADVYLPLCRQKKKVQKQKVEVITPLFSGYLFSRFSPVTMFHKIRYTRGVKNVLGSGDGLWTLDNKRIEDIRSREKEGVVVLKKREIPFRDGDRIEVDEGDFDGWEGIFFEDIPDKDRAVVMLTNVSYSSKLILPKRFLKHSG